MVEVHIEEAPPSGGIERAEERVITIDVFFAVDDVIDGKEKTVFIDKECGGVFLRADVAGFGLDSFGKLAQAAEDEGADELLFEGGFAVIGGAFCYFFVDGRAVEEHVVDGHFAPERLGTGMQVFDAGKDVCIAVCVEDGVFHKREIWKLPFGGEGRFSLMVTIPAGCN